MKALAILVYLLIQVGIAYWVSRRIHNETDYFLAGRSLPTWLLSFSLFATWFGAETCLGTAGAVFSQGLSGSRADPFVYTLCLVLLGLLLARKLWLGGYTTLADFFRERFGPHVERLAVLILVPSSLIWGAAQMRAFAQVVSSLTDWNLELTMWLCFVFVTLYTLMGGLLGDIITDLIQGVTIAIGLLVLAVTLLMLDIDWLSYFQTLPKERLSFMSSQETPWQRLDRWSIPIFGSLVAQELISRILAARNAEVAQRSAYSSALIYFFFGSLPVLIGLMGPRLMERVPDQEGFLLLLAEQQLPGWLHLIFAGAIVSAILATIDSILLSSAALLSRNLVSPLLRLRSETQKVVLARLLVVVSALFALVFALGSESIYQLVEVASSFGTAGILVITLFGLHSHLGDAKAATLTLLLGLGLFPLLAFSLKWPAPFLTTVLSAVLLYVIMAFRAPSRHA